MIFGFWHRYSVIMQDSFLIRLVICCFSSLCHQFASIQCLSLLLCTAHRMLSIQQFRLHSKSVFSIYCDEIARQQKKPEMAKRFHYFQCPIEIFASPKKQPTVAFSACVQKICVLIHTHVVCHETRINYCTADKIRRRTKRKMTKFSSFFFSCAAKSLRCVCESMWPLPAFGMRKILVRFIYEFIVIH